MSKANDLEGRQDMGGKHGGQAGMPKPDRSAAQQGIVRDEKGKEQPAAKTGRNMSAGKTEAITKPTHKERLGKRVDLGETVK